MYRSLASCVLSGAALISVTAAEPVLGWHQMRVIDQPGQPRFTHALDADGDGRQELLVVNRQFSRLDWYRWHDGPVIDQTVDGEVNHLPLATDFRHDEILLDQIPHDVLVMHDGSLWILTGPQLRLEQWIYAEQPDGDSSQTSKSWRRLKMRDLRSAQLAHHLPMIWRSQAREILIACQEGIMLVDVDSTDRPTWLRPDLLERLMQWQLVDIDADGREDLLMHLRGERSPWWSRHDSSGALRPPAPLSTDPVGWATVAAGPQPWLVAIDTEQDSLVRSYDVVAGEAHQLGRADYLALVDGAMWHPAQTSDGTGLAMLDAAESRLHWFIGDADGWRQTGTFPVPQGVSALMGVGTDMLWLRHKQDLLVSRWQDQRWTFPRPEAALMPLGEGEETDESTTADLIGMGQVGEQAWLSWKRDSDLVLTLLDAAGVPQHQVFPDQAGKAEQARWLGADRLLVRDRFAKAMRLVTVTGATSLPADRSRTLDQYHVLTPDGQPLRMVDGMVELLDDDLQAMDQLMLEDGEGIRDLIWWQGAYHALSSDGEHVHRLVPSTSGLYRVASSQQVPSAAAIHVIDQQTLLLSDQRQIIRLAPGAQRQLQSRHVIDAREGRRIDDDGVQRLATVDVDGDGQDELMLLDDIRHQIHLYRRREGGWLAATSWQVFTDEAYPYGYRDDEYRRGEPRSWLSLDMDGDGGQELAMLCHDRLLIYLSRPAPTVPTGSGVEDAK